MNQLLKLQSVRIQKIRSLSVLGHGRNYERGAPQTCSACKHLQNICRVFTRSRSTNTNLSMKDTSRPRKKRNKNKKFAELLVVTNNSTSEQRASVRKINSKDLKVLESLNFGLNELYKLKPFSINEATVEHTYNNLTIIDNFTNQTENVIEPEPDVLAGTSSASLNEDINKCEDTIVENEQEELLDSLDTPAVLNTFEPENIEDDHAEICEEEDVKTTEKSPRLVSDVHVTPKEEIICNNLSAYIEMCSNLNMPQKGLNALFYYKYHSKYDRRNVFSIKNVNVYNAILKGFACKGNFNKVKDVMKFMKQENVECNVQTFVSVFECLARINDKNSHLKMIEHYTNEANSVGITYDRIMNEGLFANDQRQLVLNAMHCYNRNYVPNYKIPNLHYNNDLLNKLNCEVQLEKPKENSNVKTDGMFDLKVMHNKVREQFEIERAGYVTIKSIEPNTEVTEDTLKYRQLLDEHFKMWEDAALTAYNRDLQTLSAKRHAMNFEVYIRAIPAKDFVNIILEEAKKIAQGSETYSPTVTLLYKDLGLKVYNKYKILRKQKTGVLDKITKIHNKYCEHYVCSHGKLGVLPTAENYLNSRHHWQWIEHKFKPEGATTMMDHQEWIPSVWQNVGKFLYNIVMHDLKIDCNVMRLNSKHKNYLPAFYTLFRNQGKVVKEEVKPHPVLSRLYRASKPETLTFPSCEVPMLCPPVPWVSVQTGGYLIVPTDMIRLPTYANVQKKRILETTPSDLYPSFDALNQLSAVPWKVNRKILDVILDVFKKGGSAKLDVPELPSSLTPPAPPTPEMDKTERFLAFRKKLQYKRKKAEMFSLWCDCLYRLSLANHFRDEVFWLPHNMDFRGRVYPVPPHLNHLGSDLARSILVFAESRPLGPEGLDWLKLHLINLTGLKKRDPISKRLEFANEILDEVFDSADNPLTGCMWWAESEEPWQTLACCMEITNAIRSGKPEEYESCFPVHQDGSCNGLQHYAALGRDSAGAHSVNLTPSESPQDVYSAVVNLVEEQRKIDAQNGIKVASVLEGFVKRKVIKQTVMTTVYGVTRFGARLQIARQLKDIKEFPKDSVWAASSYLTSRTFDSLRTMFTSTREIQDWFTECAKLISSVSGQNVEWVTPLGLPVIQPYSRFKKFTFKAQDRYNVDKFEKPNVMKQKNAFPPNFIHSLDSSHMMLTSLYCERAGITFVSVHDCYWTHPSTVHIMNKICREQFVALHSEPILENLSVFLSQKFGYSDNEFVDDGSVVDFTKKKLNKVLRQLPKTGGYDIRQVLDSVYFFS